MQPTGTHRFTLPDRYGVEHDYLVHEHPAGEGMEVMYALLAMGAPTVLGLAGAALRSEEILAVALEALSSDEQGGATRADAADLVRMVVDVDLSAVGAELGRALATGKAPDLTRKVLSRTYRDGKQLSGVHFEAAYQANYAEMLAAIWRVCTINGFFPVPGTSPPAPPQPKPLVSETS